MLRANSPKNKYLSSRLLYKLQAKISWHAAFRKENIKKSYLQSFLETLSISIYVYLYTYLLFMYIWTFAPVTDHVYKNEQSRQEQIMYVNMNIEQSRQQQIMYSIWTITPVTDHVFHMDNHVSNRSCILYGQSCQ